MKRTPRGVKNGAISLIQGERGGYVSVPKENDRLNMDSILEKFTNVKNSMEKYSETDRRGWQNVVSEKNLEDR